MERGVCNQLVNLEIFGLRLTFGIKMCQFLVSRSYVFLIITYWSSHHLPVHQGKTLFYLPLTACEPSLSGRIAQLVLIYLPS